MSVLYDRGRSRGSSPNADQLKRNETDRIFINTEEYKKKLPIVDENIELNNDQIEKYGFNPVGDDKITELRFFDNLGNIVRQNTLNDNRIIEDNLMKNDNVFIPSKNKIYKRVESKVFGGDIVEVLREDVSAWKADTDVYTPLYDEDHLPINVGGVLKEGNNDKLYPLTDRYKIPTYGLRKPIGYIKRGVNDYVGVNTDMTVVMVSGTTGEIKYFPLEEDNDFYVPYLENNDVKNAIVPEMFGTEMVGIIPIGFEYMTNLDTIIINTTKGLFTFNCNTKEYTCPLDIEVMV